jgi:hypothetical protein
MMTKTEVSNSITRRLHGTGRALDPLDDLVQADYPAYPQQVHNLASRFDIMQPSLDKRDQMFRLSDGNLTREHVAGNVQLLPWDLNRLKETHLDDCM